jgi:hypothetical protein
MQLGPRRVTVALAAVLAADGAFNTVGLYRVADSTAWGEWIKNWTKEDLDRLKFPQRLRFVFPIIKALSVLGLAGGLVWRPLGRLTGLALVIYFILAIGFHLRVRDSVARSAPAVVMLVWCFVAWRSFLERPSGSLTVA